MWGLCNVRHLISMNSTIHRFASAVSYMSSMVFFSKMNYKAVGYPSIYRYSSSISEAGKMFTLFKTFLRFMDHTAIIDQFGFHTYRDILQFSCKLASELINKYGNKQEGLKGARVGLMCESNVSYVVSLYACWLAGGVAVPLGILNPSSLDYRLMHSECSFIMVTEDLLGVLTCVKCSKDISKIILTYEQYASQFCKSNMATQKYSDESLLQFVDSVVYVDIDKPAIILYKSADGIPKIGVVLTFGNIQERLRSMCIERNWDGTDVGFFAGHAFHGCNLLEFIAVAHFCGASCVIHPRFFPKKTWQELIGIRNKKYSDYVVTKFQAPITMYIDMFTFLQKDPSGIISKQFNKRSKIDLLSLGTSLDFNKNWLLETGKVLNHTVGLEETGQIMATSVSSSRHSQFGALSGRLYEGLSCRIVVHGDTSADVVYENVGDGMAKIKTSKHGSEGELQLKGNAVFKDYWRDDARTCNSFTEDGWFRTGYVVSHSEDKILLWPPSQLKWHDGTSKRVVHRGYIYKILLSHPAISDLSVLRRPNHINEESVAIAVVLKHRESLTLDDVRHYCATNMKMQSYKTKYARQNLSYLYPSMLLILDKYQMDNMQMDKRLLYSILLRKDLYKNYNIQIHGDT